MSPYADSRWRASGVRSTLVAGPGAAQPTAAGEALVFELPSTTSRSLTAHRLNDLTDELCGGA